ncbi:hypothetical protein DSO57_1013154 [Entomophthora muscae]|uniref:Uncharacterized protein n=1 Tax=Entomophthora muscae TaxID=34485 RepID=A0ACC2TGY9_9FUNG|nr:hypothetical protein DSO57_1013154 [Entomophthora muscae]
MKLITLISLVGSLQAIKEYNPPKQVPITLQIQAKFYPFLSYATSAMDLEKKHISCKKRSEDGTCVEVACQGCTDETTLKQSSSELVRDLDIALSYRS